MIMPVVVTEVAVAVVVVVVVVANLSLSFYLLHCQVTDGQGRKLIITHLSDKVIVYNTI